MSSRVALVTGCGKRDGMGRAIALTLAASGVAVADRRPGGVPNRRQAVLAQEGVGGSDDGWTVDSLVAEIASAGGSATSVLGFTRALSADVAPWGITANAIAPGMIATSRAVLSLDPDLDVEAEVKRRGEMLAVGGSAPFANRPPTAESGPADRNSVSNGN